VSAIGGGRGLLLALWDGWDRFWLAPQPALGLAALRVVTFGTLLHFALTTGAWIEHLAAVDPWFYRPIWLFELLGIGPLPAAAAGPLRWALAIGGLAGLVGWAARPVAAASAVIYGYGVGQLYSFTNVHHGEALLLVALAACAASRCDAVLAWRWPWGRSSAPVTPAAPLPGWPLQLVRVQVALTYWLAGYAKLVLGGPGWADGATLQFYLLLRGEPLGAWVAQSPELCRLLAALSLVWELAFPLVLGWPRLGWLFVPAGVVFHLASQRLLAVGFAHFLPFLVLFLDPRALVRLQRALTWWRPAVRPARAL
jgi:hypothetical protein